MNSHHAKWMTFPLFFRLSFLLAKKEKADSYVLPYDLWGVSSTDFHFLVRNLHFNLAS